MLNVVGMNIITGRSVGIIALLLTAPALTACTVELTPGAPSSSPAAPTESTDTDAESTGEATPAAPASPASPATTATPADTATPTEDTSSTDEDDAFWDLELYERAYYEDSIDLELVCPTGSLEIDTTGVVVDILEPCDSVTVSGNGVVVLAQSVGTLTVDGIGVNAIVADATAVTITDGGNGSMVTWESGTPAVQDDSIGSTALSAASR